MDDISPTHSGTIFFLGGWFHSIGLDIYFSQFEVALHFVTNDIPGENKSDFVAARLAKSAEAWKKKEEIEALQEEIKREKDGGGGYAACPCGRMHTGVCVCVCVCVCQRKI